MSNTIMHWYKIPGFPSYDINYFTHQIRSCKHFNTGFHIMKEKNGKVRLVDDCGVSKTLRVIDLYTLTFASGHPLEPRGEFEMYTGGMKKINRRSVYEAPSSNDESSDGKPKYIWTPGGMKQI